MSTITKPIRDVLKADIIFHWDTEQKKAFELIKQNLSTQPVLAFYNVEKPVLISCDASQSGLGAVLLQDDHPVAYASRTLTDAETRYVQIKKGLLAIVFAFNKFHQYVYSKSVLVESDHKPLVCIIKKSLAAAPPGLQRMLLQHSFTLVYKPGKEIENLVSQCDICAEHHMSNPREPMTVGDIPNRPWELVSTHLFKWHGDDYLLIIDSCSRFIEISKLTDTSSSKVIQHTKSAMAYEE